MDTIFKKSNEVKNSWYLINAEGKPIGRVAAIAAHILMGKNKPDYTPNIDNCNNVVIINAKKAILTGRKPKTKYYYHYSGYVGGLKATKYIDMIQKKPLFPIEKAIKGMLPKNRLAKKIIKRLYLFEEFHNFKNVQFNIIDF